MTPSSPRRHTAPTEPPVGGLTRRGFLSVALAAGAVGAWGARPAVAASPVTAAAAAAPERPHRTLLGVL